MCSVRSIRLTPFLGMLSLVAISVILLPTANAFTTRSIVTRQSRVRDQDGFCLGPVARNGLAYEDITLGQGRRILPGDTVYCYYQGKFTTKPSGVFGKATTTIFDEITEGQPLGVVIGKGDVIPGWDLGILGGLEGEIPPMNVGGKRRLYIPAGLAYGAAGAGPIPPNQDLEFEVQVLQAGKESDISLSYRLGGYAVAVGIPAIILAVAYTLLNSN